MSMSEIVESAPFMPMDERTREIWAILLQACPDVDDIKIIKYEPFKSITFVGTYYGDPIKSKLDISWAFKNTNK